MRKFWRYNGLSLTLAALFLIIWCAQAWCGWKVFNDNQTLHHAATSSLGQYLLSGHFWQATGENWESEFLQMGFYVILTSCLYQKGSAESKDPDAQEEDEPLPPRGRRSFIYRNSLSLVFLALFIISFLLHASGALRESNQERAEHGLLGHSFNEYLGSSELWFQSFQNWQSEFLAVLSIVIFSIFLRQEGSPESKSINDPNTKTGK
jgi:hypothetical protein